MQRQGFGRRVLGDDDAVAVGHSLYLGQQRHAAVGSKASADKAVQTVVAAHADTRVSQDDGPRGIAQVNVLALDVEHVGLGQLQHALGVLVHLAEVSNAGYDVHIAHGHLAGGRDTVICRSGDVGRTGCNSRHHAVGCDGGYAGIVGRPRQRVFSRRWRWRGSERHRGPYGQKKLIL